MTSPRKVHRKQPRKLSLTLTGRGVFTLVAAAVLAALWRLLGLHGASVFCFFLSACLLLALLAVASVPRGLRTAHAGQMLRAETATATVGQAHTVYASCEVQRSPVAAVSAEWEISDYRAETSQCSTPVQVQAGEGRGVQTVLTAVTTDPRSRGPATLRLRAVHLQDPLGLVRRRVRIDESVEVLVLPRLLTGEHRVTSPEGPGAGDARQKPVDSDKRGLPGGDVREYRAGDPVRQIHWKQSARQRELLIRLPEPDTQWVVDLRLNTDPAAYTSAESFEHAVSVAATDGLRRIRAGNSVRLLVGTAEPQTCVNSSQLMRALAFVRLDEPEAVTRG